jgi:hypothetical protein
MSRARKNGQPARTASPRYHYLGCSTFSEYTVVAKVAMAKINPNSNHEQVQGGLFSYVSVESRIPANHPLRAVRSLLDEALASMSRDFDRVYEVLPHLMHSHD